MPSPTTIRAEWPKVRRIIFPDNKKCLFQVDGRSNRKHRYFSDKDESLKYADQLARSRQEYGSMDHHSSNCILYGCTATTTQGEASEMRWPSIYVSNVLGMGELFAENFWNLRPGNIQ